MNFKFVTSIFTAFLMVFFMSTFVIGQDFERGTSIPLPDPELNTGGIANFVTDVDFDGDGRTDVFVVNQNWNDGDGQPTPRIYKYEFNGDTWEIVWQAIPANYWQQNGDAGLTWGDLDQDGNKEIIWAPSEWTNATENPNPDRLIIYEQKEGAGDTLGIYDGESNFLANSKWSISSEDMDAVRPRRMVVKDIDGDDTLEVIFADRRATSGGWYFGICSVDDIPDNGDGSETWKVEARGQDFGLSSPATNKWDLAVLSQGAIGRLYLFDQVECTQILATAANTYELGISQKSVLKNAGSWHGAVVADLDGNADEEIIVGSYFNSLGEGETHGVYVYTDVWPPGTVRETAQLDTLKGFKIAELGDYFDGYGVMGGSVGDIDQDGQKEYVFGSRNADPNGAIFRMEYIGPNDSVHVAANWEFSVIDSVFPDLPDNGRWSQVHIANIDADPLLEVLFTANNPVAPSLFDPAVGQPIYVLNNLTELNLGPWQKVDVPYRFERVFAGNRGSGHGVAVDRYGNVWYCDYQAGIEVFDRNGTPIDTINQVTAPNPSGGEDTTFTLVEGRGMNTDIDGNILYGQKGSLIKIDVDTHEALAMVLVPYPLNPAVDEAGFIYVGNVIGVSPIDVIDPATFTIVQTIPLPDPPGYARGMDVSLDGLTFYPGDLTADPHVVPIYTSTDNENYFKTDSIDTDNQGRKIMNLQTVTVSTKPKEGTIWYSLDNSYGTGGDDQLLNSLVMMDFGTYEYGYLYMPPPDPPATGFTGPRNAAWSTSGDTIYVSSYNGGAIYMFVHDDVTAIGEKGPGVPIAFNLEQNYPNPFNPVTTIDFSIAKAGKATLTVFNVLGQKVVTLVNQNMPKGKFSVQFNASNYATGMYIYRLQTTEGVLQKRMMLVK